MGKRVERGEERGREREHGALKDDCVHHEQVDSFDGE